MDGSNKHKEDEEACLYSWRWLATSKLGPRVGFGHSHCHLHLFSSFVEERRQSRVDMWRWDVKNEWGAHVSWRGSFYIFCFAVMNDAGYISTSFHSCSYQLRHDHLKRKLKNCNLYNMATWDNLWIPLHPFVNVQGSTNFSWSQQSTSQDLEECILKLIPTPSFQGLRDSSSTWHMLVFDQYLVTNDPKKTWRKQSPRSQLRFPNVPGWLAGFYGLFAVMRYTASYYQPK